MRNGNRVVVRFTVKTVTVRVMTRARVGVKVRFYFAIVFAKSFAILRALRRCRMGMGLWFGLALLLGSGVMVEVRVRASLKVWVIVLFCRNMLPFLAFYAFRIYIPHSVITHCTLSRLPEFRP